MTPQEYRIALRKLRLYQTGAAEFLGISRKTSNAYANGRAEIPKAIVMLLTLMLNQRVFPETIEVLVRWNGMWNKPFVRVDKGGLNTDTNGQNQA